VIESSLLCLWDELVGSAALVAIIILTFGAMIRAVKLENILQRLVAILGIAILLMMLPTTIVSLWRSMSLTEHLGLAIVVILTIWLMGAAKRKPRRERH
jgi:hypothetical protein